MINILYCGMADDVLSPIIMVPDFDTIMAIDCFDSAFSPDGTWSGQQREIIKQLSQGSDEGTHHISVYSAHYHDWPVTRLRMPCTDVRETIGSRVDERWILNFKYLGRPRRLVYWHHRDFAKEEWPEEAKNLSHVMCMGATFPLDQIPLQTMAKTRCTKNCKLHALTFLHEVFPNQGPPGTRKPTSNVDMNWAIDNWELTRAYEVNSIEFSAGKNMVLP